INNKSNKIFDFLNINFYNENITGQGGPAMGFSYKPLWHLLLQRDMSKTQYRQALGLSTATLAKMGKGEYVSMEVLDKTCSYFAVQPNDVIEHVDEKEPRE
ncbi:helix-turn-helix domain-containing protein, partial [Paenibacillus dendritiformis]